MKTMAERSDLVGTSFHCVDDANARTVTALVCYDSHPGGLGYAQKAYDALGDVLLDAQNLVAQCRCPRGCPACVGDYDRDKARIAWALQGLWEHVTKPELDNQPQDRVPWQEVAERWLDVALSMQRLGVKGAAALAQLDAVRFGHRLVLQAHSPDLQAWLERTCEDLRAGIERAVETPDEWQLAIEVSAEHRDVALRKAIKLKRRYDDLTQDAPLTEREANESLASGFLLPGDGSVN